MPAAETTRLGLTDLHIRRVEPEVGPVAPGSGLGQALDRLVEERLHLAVDLLAQT
jgi:hypothetical protein